MRSVTQSELTFAKGYPAAVAGGAPIEHEARGRVFCSDLSRARGEPLAGTASRVDHWILVEYRGPWDRDVVSGNLLSSELKEHLREHLALLPNARLLFVRKPEYRVRPGRKAFLCSSAPGAKRVVALELEQADDLRGIDLAGVLESGAGGSPVPWLYAVCTHGKRDACCARFGRPLYDALRDVVDPEVVWQCTHVGGDRFAGNVVVLPDGLYYGRVAPDDVAGVVRALGERRLDLERYRGRSRYSFAVQSAEHWIRQRTGLTGIDDLELVGSSRDAEGATVARFRTPASEIHEVVVGVGLAGEPAQLTCNSSEPRRARRCVERAYRVLNR